MCLAQVPFTKISPAGGKGLRPGLLIPQHGNMVGQMGASRSEKALLEVYYADYLYL